MEQLHYRFSVEQMRKQVRDGLQVHLRVCNGLGALRECYLQIQPHRGAAALVDDDVIHFVHDPLLVDTGNAGAARQHTRTAAGGQRRVGIHFADCVANPEQVFGEPVLVEARPVVPKRAIRARQRAAVLRGRWNYFVEAVVVRAKDCIGLFDCLVLLLQPLSNMRRL